LSCDWLKAITTGGLCKLLRRIGISYKRGLEFTVSPDPDCEAKLSYARTLLKEVNSSNGRLVLGYLDELSYYRQPSVSRAYEERGHKQPKAMRSVQTDVLSRILGVLDTSSGRVLYHQGHKAGVSELVELYRAMVAAYPDAQRIYVLQDNTPTHFHPDVLVALEPQECPWPMRPLPNWPKEPSSFARNKWGSLRLPIQIVPLPTYAPWTNYIEKLWRKLKQEVLHMHNLADKLDELHALVAHFLDRFSEPNEELLRYVGLLTPD
jgi:hypothetical protein